MAKEWTLLLLSALHGDGQKRCNCGWGCILDIDGTAGMMFGPDQPVLLHLLDLPVAMGALKGVVMELQDAALPLLVKPIVATSDIKEAYSGVDVICMVGAFPRKDGMERKDLLEKNAAIFREQGEAIAKFASRDVRVVVVGNPANTNALIALRCASGLKPHQFSALTRLDHNRAVGLLAEKLSVPVCAVTGVVIWGNHSSTQFADLSRAMVAGKTGSSVPALSLLESDPAWYESTFLPAVQQRGAAVISARKASSAASAAKAVCDHMRCWMLGTAPGEVVSMAVPSDGSYGIDAGLVFSFPVTCSPGGHYKIVPDWPANTDLHRRMIRKTLDELRAEKEAAFAFLKLQ